MANPAMIIRVPSAINGARTRHLSAHQARPTQTITDGIAGIADKIIDMPVVYPIPLRMIGRKKAIA